jgi:hypothetical protein
MLRPMRRISGLLLSILPFALSALTGCDTPSETGASTTSAAAARPAIEVVARQVSLVATLTGNAPGASEKETWEALDGQMWVVVTAEVARNECADGDKISSAHASLIVDKKTIKATGGGETEGKLCVLCQAEEPKGCSGGSSGLKPFSFVFSVPKDADTSKAVLRYKDRDAALSGAKVIDKRGNDEVNAEIKGKHAQIEKLKKTLENTGSIPKGKIILGEIEQIEKEIEALENRRK